MVDKATKLESICNRIHEIRTRFEVLWRDAEIDYYRNRLDGRKDETQLTADLQARKDKLREDFAFVAACNVGGEFLADEKIDLRIIQRALGHSSLGTTARYVDHLNPTAVIDALKSRTW